MRILTVSAKPPVNRALAERTEFDVWALSPHQVEGDLPYAALRYDRGKKLSLQAIRQVRNGLIAAQPDVVHAFYPRPLAHTVLAATSLGMRVPIVSYRGITSLPSRWSPDEWITYLSPRVAAHACESEAVRESLVAAGLPRERCHVVHNCLSKPVSTHTRQAARAILGLPDDAFVVMMVANMRRVKGADVLLNAALACRHLPLLRVVLVGKVLDPRVASLAKDPRLEGIVRLAGFRPDASELAPAADLFVMPSRAEALSVALLEAMTQGICPVVSDAGGMKEAVRHGVDGVVFSREDAAALAKAICGLHADPRRLASFAASAQSRAVEHFSATAMVDRMARLYQGLRQVG